MYILYVYLQYTYYGLIVKCVEFMTIYLVIFIEFSYIKHLLKDTEICSKINVLCIPLYHYRNPCNYHRVYCFAFIDAEGLINNCALCDLCLECMNTEMVNHHW